jgi:hypothetical protein
MVYGNRIWFKYLLRQFEKFKTHGGTKYQRRVQIVNDLLLMELILS